jgi:hypothetical protein
MRFLFFIAIIAGVFWWFAPQTTRDQAVDLGRSATTRAVKLAGEYRQPVWDRIKQAATDVREKGAALIRTQLHRAVDENVQ